MTSALPPETARSLAAVSRSLVGEWGLTPDPVEDWGRSSHVVPVRTADGVPAVLKVAAADPGTEHEALALQHWGGRGAVRPLRADPRRRAVLLERLERRDLTQEWDGEPAPLLWNRLEEAEGDVRRTVRVRFETVVDAAGLDEDRARAWAVVRLVLNAFWSVRSDRPDPAYVTRMLTVLKAVQS